MAIETDGPLLAGRYRVLGRLGAGGMATVFLTQDQRLGRQVAVKRLHAGSAEDVAQRFEREAKVGASLNHPNIVAVYDTVTDDDDVLIVMEYVDGSTLREEIMRGPLPPARAIEIVAAVAGALDHAHAHGVVHRDVKPANVLLGANGIVKLADLGIATAAERTSITQSGAVLGTAAYMAPERLDGHSGDPPVDIYALAAVAFEMLSGQKVVTGKTALEVARRVVTQPPADLAAVSPGTPPAAAEALKRGLAKDPRERPASAGELVRSLASAYSATAETARPHERRSDEPPEAPSRGEEIGAAAAGAAIGAAAADAAARPDSSPEPDAPPAAEPVDKSEAVPAAEQTHPPAKAPVAAAQDSPPARPAPEPRPAAGRYSRGFAPVPPAARMAAPAAARPASKPRARRLAPVLAALAALIVIAAIVVAVTSGGGATKRTAASSARGSHSTSGHTGSTAGSSQATSSSNGSPSASGGSTAAAAPAGSPAAAFTSFYTLPTKGDFAGAWALATPNLRQEVGGYDSWRGGEQDLRSISFPELRVTSGGSGSATLQFSSVAQHAGYVDHCSGGAALVRGASSWQVDRLTDISCTRS